MSGFDAIIRSMRVWQDKTIRSAAAGAGLAADMLEHDAKVTRAYDGMSGATRASTIAYVATEKDSGAAYAQAAHAQAAGLLQGFSGHDGKPQLDSISGPGRDELWIVLTVPTDYIIKMEETRGGEKAFLADTFFRDVPGIAQLIESALRGANT